MAKPFYKGGRVNTLACSIKHSSKHFCPMDHAEKAMQAAEAEGATPEEAAHAFALAATALAGSPEILECIILKMRKTAKAMGGGK